MSGNVLCPNKNILSGLRIRHTHIPHSEASVEQVEYIGCQKHTFVTVRPNIIHCSWSKQPKRFLFSYSGNPEAIREGRTAAMYYLLVHSSQVSSDICSPCSLPCSGIWTAVIYNNVYQVTIVKYVCICILMLTIRPVFLP